MTVSKRFGSILNMKTTTPLERQGISNKTLAEMLKDADAKAKNGNWYPANGGTEIPFTSRSGRTLLYCWQPTTGRHAYLDCGTDLILSDEEAALAMEM